MPGMRRSSSSGRERQGKKSLKLQGSEPGGDQEQEQDQGARLKIVVSVGDAEDLGPCLAGTGDLGPEASGNLNYRSQRSGVVGIGGEPTEAGEVVVRLLIILRGHIERVHRIAVSRREAQAGERVGSGDN